MTLRVTRCLSEPVIIGFEWSSFIDTEIFALIIAQFREVRIEDWEMQTGHVFV